MLVNLYMLGDTLVRKLLVSCKQVFPRLKFFRCLVQIDAMLLFYNHYLSLRNANVFKEMLKAIKKMESSVYTCS